MGVFKKVLSPLFGGGSSTKTVVQEVEPAKVDPTPTSLSDVNADDDKAATKKERRKGFASTQASTDRDTIAAAAGRKTLG